MTRGRIRVGAVVAGAIVIALALWLVMSARKTQTVLSGPVVRSAPPAEHAPLSERGLIADADQLHMPVYWVGPRANVGYELDLTQGGRTYVRYLPRGVAAGDPRPDFLTVGTYDLPHPLADLRTAGHERGGETVHLRGGAVAFMDRSRPTSAFIVGRNWKAQVEVYDPTPGRAMELVLKGDVQPIR